MVVVVVVVYITASNTMFVGPAGVYIANRTSIYEAILQGAGCVTDRLSD